MGKDVVLGNGGLWGEELKIWIRLVTTVKSSDKKQLEYTQSCMSFK